MREHRLRSKEYDKKVVIDSGEVRDSEIRN